MSGPLSSFVSEQYGEDPECPDHIHLKVLTLARTLEEDPATIYPLILTAIAELTRGIEQIQQRLLDVHSEIAWLDEHLSRVYPAWYHNGK